MEVLKKTETKPMAATKKHKLITISAHNNSTVQSPLSKLAITPKPANIKQSAQPVYFDLIAQQQWQCTAPEQRRANPFITFHIHLGILAGNNKRGRETKVQ